MRRTTFEIFQYTWGWLWYSHFSKVHMVETNFLLENLWISEPSSGILEKIKCSSAFLNMKDNYAVLFWSTLHWLFRYASKYTFLHEKKILIDSHVKISGRNYWYARFWQKLLLFLQVFKFIHSDTNPLVLINNFFHKKYNIDHDHDYVPIWDRMEDKQLCTLVVN